MISFPVSDKKHIFIGNNEKNQFCLEMINEKPICYDYEVQGETDDRFKILPLVLDKNVYILGSQKIYHFELFNENAILKNVINDVGL